MRNEIIITGGDAGFFPFLIAAIGSLRAHPQTAARDLGVIDQGLTNEQREQLAALGCTIVRPEWTLPVPHEARSLRNIGLVARTALREYFPGYNVYVWFDADAWMQTPEFLSAYVEGALANGAAVAREDGPGYRRSLADLRWWAGNMVASFGAIDGLRCALATSINIGLVALSDTAPHWEAWKRLYTKALERTGKVNMDQHAFLAAIHLQGLPTSFLAARFNWLPHLSAPIWNPELRMLCEPLAPYRPLSVIHLAGPRKERPYELATTNGTKLTTSLTFPAIRQLATMTTGGGGLEAGARKEGRAEPPSGPSLQPAASSLTSVSVVIPAYNCADTIQDAIATARAQTHRPREIIVIDDASSDGTLEKLSQVAGPDLVVIRSRRNAGGAAARNRGIDYARGDVIAFLDADDLWAPDKLEKQLALLNANPGPAFCFSAVSFVNEYGERRISPRRPPKSGESLPDFMLKYGNLVQTSSIVVPRHLLAHVRFTETLRRFQDIDFVLQLDASGVRALYVPDALVDWRNVGNPKRVSSNADASIIHAFVARHGHRLTFAQRLGLEIRSFGPPPGALGGLRWCGRVLLSVGTGALAAPHALSLLLKHTLGLRYFGALRSRLGVGS